MNVGNTIAIFPVFLWLQGISIELFDGLMIKCWHVDLWFEKCAQIKPLIGKHITACMLRLQVGNECLTLNHLWPYSRIPAKGSTWLQSKIIQLFQNFSHSHSKKLQNLLWPRELYFRSKICFPVPNLAIESVVLACTHEFHVQVLFWLMKL